MTGPGIPAGLKAALSDRYRIERELGAGGMATVYLAHDVRHHRNVALKVLKPELASALGADRFLREIETTAGLRHPHILPLYDSGHADDALFYVMPYAEGETLRERLSREKQLPVEDAVRIASEVADALAHAHRNGIIHRDIKPENILLESGHAVVADFGIARAIDAAGGTHLTETGLSVGTPTYMSPEQASGSGEPDGRSDLYTLGCMLYEMLAGQPPFSGTNAGAVIRQHLAVAAPPVDTLRPGVPPALAAAVHRALAKDPADRFHDVNAFREALAQSSHVPPAAGPVSVTPGRRWSRRTTAGIAVGSIVVAAIAMGTLTRRSRSASAEAASVAVLPFRDLNPDQSDAYLGDGIAETLRSALNNVPGLIVAAQSSSFSFREGDRDITEIGRQLNVATVLSGSVQRAASRLRVVASIVRTSDRREVWSGTFERNVDEIFALQDEVATGAAEALRGRLLGGVATAQPGTDSLAAYDAYLQGRFFWNKRAVPDLVESIRYFNLAIERDSAYALAWAGLADAWLVLPFYSDTIPTASAIPRARGAAEHALDLDPDLAEAHASLAYALFIYDWDWAGAEREFGRALDLNPRYATAWKWYADLLAALGRQEEALAAADSAVQLDPRSPNTLTTAGKSALFLGRRELAEARIGQALKIDPTFPTALTWGSWLYWTRGDTARYFDVAARLDVVSGYARVPVGRLREAMAAGGPDAVLRLQTADANAHRNPVDRAIRNALLGNFDAAFADLDQAAANRSAWLLIYVRWPLLEPLHADPRFRKLLDRIGLPDN